MVPPHRAPFRGRLRGRLCGREHGTRTAGGVSQEQRGGGVPSPPPAVGGDSPPFCKRYFRVLFDQRPSLRSERVYLAHGHPRPSTRYAGPPATRVLPLRCGPSDDCRARPCGKCLWASRKAGPLSTPGCWGCRRSVVAEHRHSRLDSRHRHADTDSRTRADRPFRRPAHRTTACGQEIGAHEHRGRGAEIQRRGESHATEVSEGHGRSGQGGFRRSCDLVGGLITTDKRLIHTRSYTDCAAPECDRISTTESQPQSHSLLHQPARIHC